MPDVPSTPVAPPLRPALVGEFLGTAFLIVVGGGVVASEILMATPPSKLAINTAWGLAVTLAVYEVMALAAPSTASATGLDGSCRSAAICAWSSPCSTAGS